MVSSNRRYSGRSFGFTLVELLVVVSIIALLIAILLPSLRKARMQAKALKCQTQLRAMATGVITYGEENRNQIPLNSFNSYAVPPEVDVERGRDYPWPILLMDQVGKQREVFHCPSMPANLRSDVSLAPGDDYSYFEITDGYPCSYEMKIDLGATPFDPSARRQNRWETAIYLPPEFPLAMGWQYILQNITMLDRIRTPGNVMLFADRYWWHKDKDNLVKRQIIMVDGHAERARDLAETGVEDTEYYKQYFYFDTMNNRPNEVGP